MKKIPTESEVVEEGNIPVQIYPTAAGTGFSRLVVKISGNELDLKPTINAKLNILWMYLKFKSNNNFPGWNGFMNLLTNAWDFDLSSIIFTPFINAPPSDYNTLYTAILNSVENARSLGEYINI